MEDLNDLRKILDRVSVTPKSTKSHKRIKKKGKVRQVKNKIDNFMKKYVDFSMKVEIHKVSSVATVELKGHLESPRQFNERVVDVVMHKIYSSRGLRFDTKLVLDLRNLFFVSFETAESIAHQHLPWINDRFIRVCVVTPASEILTNNLFLALNEYLSRDDSVDLSAHRVVFRARDVKDVI